MESNKFEYIIKHFGCYTQMDGENVLTSLATMSFVPVDEFWNVFTGDAYKYFQISKADNEKELVLILDDVIRKRLEREIEYERVSKLKIGFGWEWINKKYVRCYFEDETHRRKIIPFLFAFDGVDLQGRNFSVLSHQELDTAIFDEANLAPVNSGATEVKWAYLGDSAYTLKGGKYGSLNKMGNVQIPLIYDECVRFTNPNTAIAIKEGKKFLINKWGESLSNDFDDFIRFYGDFCIVKKNHKFGVIDYNLDIIVPVEYDQIECKRYPHFNTVLLYIGSHCGLFDLKERKFLVDIAYDVIEEHNENKDVFSVCINNKWGLIDRNSFVIVPVEYKYIATYNGDGLVYKNGKYGIVDKVMSGDNHSWIWKDTSFNECIPCIYDEVYNTDGEVTHTESLFLRYRYYFAQCKRDNVQLDCYYKEYHKKNGCKDYYNYKLLTSLYCDKENIKNTIAAFEVRQKNEPSFSCE